MGSVSKSRHHPFSATALVSLSVSLVLMLSSSTSASAQPSTTQPSVWKTVTVTLKDRSLSLNKRSVDRGTYVSFVVTNAGRIQRGFTIGGLREHFVKPGATYRFELFFDIRGDYPYQSDSPRRGALVLRGSFQVD